MTAFGTRRTRPLVYQFLVMVSGSSLLSPSTAMPALWSEPQAAGVFPSRMSVRLKAVRQPAGGGDREGAVAVEALVRHFGHVSS